jgi:hypothetical protein
MNAHTKSHFDDLKQQFLNSEALVSNCYYGSEEF